MLRANSARVPFRMIRGMSAPDTPAPAHPPRTPTWVLRAQAPGSSEWADRQVVARSLLRAEAIVRREGWRVDSAASRLLEDPSGSSRSQAAVPPMLGCGRCGYLLDGLVVNSAVVECPECGLGQAVIAFVPVTGIDRIEAKGGGCARVALLVLVLILSCIGALVLLAYAVAFLLAIG